MLDVTPPSSLASPRWRRAAAASAGALGASGVLFELVCRVVDLLPKRAWSSSIRGPRRARRPSRTRPRRTLAARILELDLMK